MCLVVKRYCYGPQKLPILDAACMCQWELHVATSRCVSGSLVTPAQAMMTWPLSRRQFSLVQVSHAHATISLHWLAETQFHYWSDPVLVLILLLRTPREKICAHKSFLELKIVLNNASNIKVIYIARVLKCISSCLLSNNLSIKCKAINYLVLRSWNLSC